MAHSLAHREHTKWEIYCISYEIRCAISKQRLIMSPSLSDISLKGCLNYIKKYITCIMICKINRREVKKPLKRVLSRDKKLTNTFLNYLIAKIEL